MSSITQSSLILTEKYYNTERIDFFLSIDTNHPEYDDELMWSTDQQYLFNIKDNRINGSQTVEYKLKESDGRLYPTPYSAY
jgi:hypothetical protein